MAALLSENLEMRVGLHSHNIYENKTSSRPSSVLNFTWNLLVFMRFDSVLYAGVSLRDYEIW